MQNEQGWPPKDTPRTNAAALEINRPNPEGCDQLDWPSFARRLERENAKLRAMLSTVLTEATEQRCLTSATQTAARSLIS